jgi:hypothetical protein
VTQLGVEKLLLLNTVTSELALGVNQLEATYLLFSFREIEKEFVERHESLPSALIPSRNSSQN